MAIDAPTELVPILSLTMSQDTVNNNNQHQVATKSKKKGGMAGTKKAKGSVAKVSSVKPEQANKVGTLQKNEFTALESVFTQRVSAGTDRRNVRYT